MSRWNIVVDLSEGCGVCPFEHAGRCVAILTDASATCAQMGPRVPTAGVHEDCPLQDDQVVEVIGRGKP